MFDIHFKNCNKYQIDMIKAYFIVNNRQFKDDGDDLCFYTDTAGDFFSVVNGLQIFFQEHSYAGVHCRLDLSCCVEDGMFCLVDNSY